MREELIGMLQELPTEVISGVIQGENEAIVEIYNDIDRYGDDADMALALNRCDRTKTLMRKVAEGQDVSAIVSRMPINDVALLISAIEIAEADYEE